MENSQQETLSKILVLAEELPDLIVLWLYGSRAKNNYRKDSDFDLAIAFDASKREGNQDEYYTDQLSSKWTKKTNQEISIVDINKISVPLATTIIAEGLVVLSKNDLRLHSEMQRIWSLWELFSYEHKRQRK
jgi:predicted nucleotidyltransferase